MRLPRRVPWASIAELDQVCAWIYTDENDLDAKTLAINRISAWKAITTLPHALESTLSILSVIVQDSSEQGSSSYLHIRQSYASAIIRLVNGLVDPLQVGAYARSIASIATQLNLPAWLVELRHAATHEDLPSIEVLREAARDAMAWLLNNYFIPAINPTAPQPLQASPLRPVLPLLMQYKTLLKITTRDASLRSEYRPEITKILRDIERWIAEAKVAADISAATLDWDTSGSGDDADDTDGRERWALERFSDALLEKGGLVPVSKKKRAVSAASFCPSSGIISIWSPLLNHIQVIHPALSSILVSKIISSLFNTDDEDHVAEEEENIALDSGGDAKRDLSYEMCVASWVNWLVSTFGNDNVTENGDNEEKKLKRENAVVALVTDLGPTKAKPAAGDSKAARLLLEALCAGRPHLQAIQSLVASPGNATSSSWDELDLNKMTERLDKLVSSNSSHHMSASPNTTSDLKLDASPPSAGTINLPPGWRALSVQEGWRPAPIGVYIGIQANL